MAFERSELPVSFCPSCKGAAVPIALVFDPAGSGRTAQAPLNGTGFAAPGGVAAVVPSSEGPLPFPALRPADARHVLRSSLLEEAAVFPAPVPPAPCRLDVASPHCTHFLLDSRTLGPCNSRRKQCSHCSLLSREASREASEATGASSANRADVDRLSAALDAAEIALDNVLEPGPIDVNSCTDVAVLRSAVNRLVQQQTRQRQRDAARDELLGSLQKEVLDLRREFAGAAAGDDNLDVPIDLCANEAENIALVLGSDECTRYIAENVPNELTRIIFRNMVQIALSKSPHAANGLRHDPLANVSPYFSPTRSAFIPRRMMPCAR